MCGCFVINFIVYSSVFFLFLCVFCACVLRGGRRMGKILSSGFFSKMAVVFLYIFCFLLFDYALFFSHCYLFFIRFVLFCLLQGGGK